MDTEQRKAIAKSVKSYLNMYSKSRKILRVIRPGDGETVFKSSEPGDATVTTSNKYLLYRGDDNTLHAYLSKDDVVTRKPNVRNMKHVPTFFTQRAYQLCTEKDIESLNQKTCKEFYEIEDENIAKLIEVAFSVNCMHLRSKLLKVDKNIIQSKDLKTALAKANSILKYRANTDGKEISFNVLSNVSYNVTNIHDSVKVNKEKGALSYKNNTLFTSSKIPGGVLYVMPSPEYLGVMPIVDDIYILLDKSKIITFYQMGMSILHTDNIIKIELSL